MKLTFLVIAAAFLIAYFLFELMHWQGKIYLMIGSLLFFVLSIFVEYNKKVKETDTLDNDFLDDV